jgi:CBS domain-containing protein
VPTTAGQICNREVVYAKRDTTVAAAAKLMRHYHVGSLVVVDEVNGGRVPVGLVTDRDIVIEITAMDLDPAVITLGDIMDPNLVTARESEGILETIEIMRYRGVRRLPVVTADGRLAGIVTLDDLIEILAEELNELARIVAREQAREKSTRK